MYRRNYGYGGKVNYGLGGALLKVGSNLAQGKGFGSGALQGVGKAAITPGSAIGAGAELGGALLQKSDNPLAQKLGKGLDVASNFAPGGGGIKGAIGDVAGMAAGGGAGGGVLGNVAGALGGGVGGAAGGLLGQAAGALLGQSVGGSVPFNPEAAGAPYRMRGVGLVKAQAGMNVGDPTKDLMAALTRATAGSSDEPRERGAMDFSDLNELQQSRSDRESAFGTASTDVFMPTGAVEAMLRGREETPEELPEETPRPEDMQEIGRRGPSLLKSGAPRPGIKEGGSNVGEGIQKGTTGYVYENKVRGNKVPTMYRFMNKETGKVEERMMEPEEIADWMYRNQIRNPNKRSLTRDQFMERAESLSRAPGAR
jgi:hypothetical protein